MARQSVTKHLAVLEAANLVTTARRGREKLHFLNAAPINDIADRWIDRYHPQAGAGARRPEANPGGQSGDRPGLHASLLSLLGRRASGPPRLMWKVSSRLILSPVKVKISVKTKATRQDRLVVGAPEALEVRLHDRLVRCQGLAPQRSLVDIMYIIERSAPLNEPRRLPGCGLVAGPFMTADLVRRRR